MKGTLIFEPRKFKDFSYSKIFGAAPEEEIKPLGRWEAIEAMNLPITFQGAEQTCVPCSVIWMEQYLERTGVDLSHEFLAEEAQVGTEGAGVDQVFSPARKVGICEQDIYDKEQDSFVRELNAAKHRTPNHFYVNHRSPQALYAALKEVPLFIGVRNWNNVRGGHFMVAADVMPDGSGLRMKNWWDRGKQGEAFVAWKDVKLAIAYRPLPAFVTKVEARLPFYDVLMDKLHFLFQKYVTI